LKDFTPVQVNFQNAWAQKSLRRPLGRNDAVGFKNGKAVSWSLARFLNGKAVERESLRSKIADPNTYFFYVFSCFSGKMAERG